MTTNFEIDDALKKLKKYRGCIFRENVNKKLLNGYYVVNMDDSSGSGTHWTGLVLQTNKAIYFDPFGIHPPDEIATLKRRNRKVYYNSDQLQHKTADTCGLWCVAYIRYMDKNNGDFSDFLNLFTYDTIKNEKKLKSMT